MATHNWTTQDIPSQKGKTILITVANSGIGIGLEATTVLAGKGAKVILTSRGAQKGQDAINTIKQQNPSVSRLPDQWPALVVPKPRTDETLFV